MGKRIEQISKKEDLQTAYENLKKHSTLLVMRKIQFKAK